MAANKIACLQLYAALKTTCVRTVALLLVPLTLAGCAVNGQKRQMAMFEELFTKAVNNSGQVYAESRDELMDNGLEAVEFLKPKGASGSSEQERWLAEIILARAENPVQFREMEKSFHEKVMVLIYVDPWGKPRWDPDPGPRHEGRLLLPDDPLPFQSHRTLEEEEGISRAATIRSYYEFVRISKLPLWGHLASEILLKGWTVPADVLWQAPPPQKSRSGKYEPPTATGPLALVPGGAALEQDDYVIYAMELLGSLGERRTGQKMLDILKDETQNSARRLYATRALGRLHYEAALPTFLNLVEADETHRTLRYCVFDALARMRDERAVPTLERISSWPEKYEPDVETSIDWAARAKQIIKVIRGEDTIW